MDALRRVCAQLRVYPGTFDVVAMTTAQLEHAATAPSRIPAFLERELGIDSDTSEYPLLHPLDTRKLRAKLPRGFRSEEKDPGNFESFVLLTGGRYLISRTDRGFLQLWDLSIAGADLYLEPLATMELVEDISTSIVPFYTNDLLNSP
jgi:hypothetical protein